MIAQILAARGEVDAAEEVTRSAIADADKQARALACVVAIVAGVLLRSSVVGPVRPA